MDFHSPVLWLTLLYGAGFATAPSVLLRRQGQPYAAAIWLLLLFAVPGVGVLTWWLIGRTKLAGGSAETATVGTILFPTEGSAIELLVDGREAYPAMERAISRATRRVDVMFYIWHDDETGRRVRDLLATKAAEGVPVRVLVDAFGTPHFRGAFVAPIVAAGGKVAQFFPQRILRRHPLVNFINHRKIIAVDEIAFTGGMNIGDEYAYEWRDLMLRVDGAAAAALSHIFDQDWDLADGQRDTPKSLPGPTVDDADCVVIASGPDQGHSWMHLAFFQNFVAARERIWIATPYFIPSDALMVALELACVRGVDVRLVVPANSDVVLVRAASQSYYPRLLRAGVRIFEYQGPMLHAKALLVDQEVASVGTANLDSRSFRLSFEVGCFMRRRDLNEQLAGWYGELLDNSCEITKEVVADRGLFSRLWNSTVHLFSPLM